MGLTEENKICDESRGKICPKFTFTYITQDCDFHEVSVVFRFSSCYCLAHFREI
jgi:hypothetical protein